MSNASPASTDGELPGLTATEAAARLQAGEGNTPSQRHGRSVAQIVRANVMTRFNAILGALLVVILVLGPSRDGLFGIILVANTLIGIVQEVLAKRTSDRLTVITAAKVHVRRDGIDTEVETAMVVRGDVVGLQAGDQVVVDGPVLASVGLEINESLLTGEAEPQSKPVGANLRSGSFVTAGTGFMRADEVGDASYANTLSAQVRNFVPVQSELRAATDKVLLLVTWAIGPIATALLVGQRLGGETWKSAVFGAATGVVEIVPEGFVLLTSVTLAMSIVRLGRSGVLVKELAAVEGLARVDTMCFDKTGTLTEGDPVVDDVVPCGTTPLADIVGALSALTVEATNGTGIAMQAYLQSKDRTDVKGDVVPFSSTRKWAALSSVGMGTDSASGTWVMGAPEVLLDVGDTANDAMLAEVDKRTELGRRVLVLARSDSPMKGDTLPTGLQACGLIALKEQIRKDARSTLDYFAKQGVDVKIISGDSPTTVAAIALAAGLHGLDEARAIVDARSLTDDTALFDSIVPAHVVGRTSPEQKRSMVKGLQQQGRTVAMTGDGVNDALALKAADLGIAMGAGSEATKAVAQLILVHGNFAALPGVVAEGRRVIANVERVAKLFITKTIYAGVLAITTGIAQLPFPFLPRQLTLISSLTIGIPGFFLAFTPDGPVAKPGFMRRVVIFAVPAGLIAAVATFAVYRLALVSPSTSISEARTAATMVLGLTGLWIVDVLARPHSKWRTLLIGLITSLAVCAFAVPWSRRFWVLEFPVPTVMLEAAAIAISAVATIEIGWRVATASKRFT